MKKIIISIFIGAALVYSGSAMADSISKIGKKVDAEYTVFVDGKELTVKAIGVEGVSTTPNRALAEAVGYDVEFRDNTIYFNKKIVERESDIREEPKVENAGDKMIGELEQINEKLLETDYKFKIMAEARGRLIDEGYNATPERKNEIEIEIKKLEADYEPVVEERVILLRRKAELEAK
jgi:hypothetical protein